MAGRIAQSSVYRDRTAAKNHYGVLDEPDQAVLEGASLIVRYDSDADVVVVKLRDDPPVDAVEEEDGIVISYDARALR